MEDDLSKKLVQKKPVLVLRSWTLRSVILLVTLVVAVAGFAMMNRMKEPGYTPLIGNLTPEDTVSIVRVLREKQISFKLDSSGKSVSVPTEKLNQARADLAISGLLQSSGVGYEIFDKQTLGTTSYVQKINQKRALEGELMRTINQIHGIRRSRVHLAIPQKTAFSDDQKRSTASVVLDLDSTVVLSPSQVSGVANLIARAVEGMDVADVVIVDSNGKTLSQNMNDLGSASVANQHDYQRKIESEIEDKIEQLLGRIVGDGHVAAKASAELALPAAGDIKKLSVTVVVDGKHVRSYGKDGTFETKMEYWSHEKLREFEELVTSAIGLNMNRGDTLDIKNMEFIRGDVEDGHLVYPEKTVHSNTVNNYFYGFVGLLVGVLCLMLFLLLVRSPNGAHAERSMRSTIYSSGYSQNSSPNVSSKISIDEIGLSIQRSGLNSEGEVVREKIIDLIDADPHKAALIIKDWLKTGKLQDSEDDPQEDFHVT